MTYLPNIPSAPDKISQSQIDLKNNFQQLNAGFQVDHNAYDAALAGEHKQITIPVALVADPTLANPAGMFYTKQVAAVTQAFFSNGTTVSQLTGLPEADAGTGYYKFPSGLIFQWGIVNGSGTNSTQITFTIPFPTNVFNIQLTAVLSNVDTTAKSVSVQSGSILPGRDKFSTQQSSTSVGQIYWFAIGN